MRTRLALFLLLLAAATSGALVLRARNAVPSHAAAFDRLPERIGDLRAMDAGPLEPGRVPLRLQESCTFRVRTYWNPARGDLVELLVAYAPSHERATRMAASQSVLPRGGWRVIRESRWSPSLPGSPGTVNEALIARDGQREVLVWWLLTRSGPVASADEFHWALTRNALAGRPTDAALVRLALQVRDEDAGAARRELRALFANVVPAVADALPIAPPPAP